MLASLVIFKVGMLVFAYMVGVEIGKDGNIKLYSVDTAEHKSLRGDLHRHYLYARFYHVCHMLVYVIALGSGVFGVEKFIASHVAVCSNKTDLGASHGDHKVCAKTGEGVEELKQTIYEAFVDGDVIAGGMMLTDARHVSALTASAQCLRRALACLEPAVMTVDLREAVSELGKIDGATVSEEITDAIFAKFCLGK